MLGNIRYSYCVMNYENKPIKKRSISHPNYEWKMAEFRYPVIKETGILILPCKETRNIVFEQLMFHKNTPKADGKLLNCRTTRLIRELVPKRAAPHELDSSIIFLTR